MKCLKDGKLFVRKNVHLDVTLLLPGFLNTFNEDEKYCNWAMGD